MAYTPTEWQTGDIVTSAKLNKLENGVAGLYLPITFTVDMVDNTTTVTADKTYAEITAALLAGVPLVAVYKYTFNGNIYGVCFHQWEVGSTPEQGYIEFRAVPGVTGSGVYGVTLIIDADDTVGLYEDAYPANP